MTRPSRPDSRDLTEAAENEPAARLPLVTPGEILLEEFLIPLDISQNKLARDLDIPPSRVADIIHGRRGITADTAVRLSTYFGTSAELWLNLQTAYDLKIVLRSEGEAIKARVRPRAA